jgi:hypothetical protein
MLVPMAVSMAESHHHGPKTSPKSASVVGYNMTVVDSSEHLRGGFGAASRKNSTVRAPEEGLNCTGVTLREVVPSGENRLRNRVLLFGVEQPVVTTGSTAPDH